MKLVPNAKRIALRAHSMWANYLGLACLLAPELIYATTERDTNPRWWWIAALVLIAYAIVGRLKDQGIDTKARSSAGVTVAAFLAVAVPFVGGWEGMRNHAYLDIVNVPTICYGHTKGVQLGDYMTDAECEALFEAELIHYRDGLHEYFTPRTKAEFLTPERDTAYVSLAYNVGIRGAGRSTATRRLNAGWIAGGCEALTWWNRAGNRVVRGLVRRRGAEYDLCMQGIA